MALIQRIDIRNKTTAIHLSVNHLCTLLQDGLENCPAAVNISSKQQLLTLKVDFDLKRCGLGVRMLIDGNPAGGKTEPDMKLIRLIARAHRVNQRLTCRDGSGNSGLSLSDIAKEEGYSGSYATRLLRLAFLSPKITTAILNGRQSADLTPATLMRDTKKPHRLAATAADNPARLATSILHLVVSLVAWLTNYTRSCYIDFFIRASPIYKHNS